MWRQPRRGAERDEALMRCWVRKEAVVKAWGIGIGTDLARVPVRPDAESAVVERGPERWEAREVTAVADCLTAYARPTGTPGSVVVHPPVAVLGVRTARTATGLSGAGRRGAGQKVIGPGVCLPVAVQVSGCPSTFRASEASEESAAGM
ncbi:4'-phosphopantetheinyl transferase superfamily protein [Streptomyces sp. NPDC005151]